MNGQIQGMTVAKTILLFSMLMFIFSNIIVADENKKGIDIKGDFRYRHEMIDQQERETQNRHRIRARLYLTGQVTNESHITVGISSGSDDPVSNNQTLTDGFSSKPLLIDLAYIEYIPDAVPGLKLLGGKVKNPFYYPVSSELIWDSDIRPEGLVAHYKTARAGLGFQLTGTWLWIQERKSDHDSYLAAFQALTTYPVINDKGNLTAGIAFYDYINIRGFPTFWDDEDSYQNTVDDSGWYANDYELLELYAAFDFGTHGIPINLFADYVTNSAADSVNDGWLMGISLGEVKNRGSWDFRYIYREINKDAVVGLFTDSDFRGGGTDAKGHEMGLGYQLLDKTTLAATYFYNLLGIEEELDFHRIQIDIKYKF